MNNIKRFEMCVAHLNILMGENVVQLLNWFDKFIT